MESDETESDSHDKSHLHRPMNAFLLFCKQHRSVVRDKYPSIENRAVTKILGEWWSKLDEEEKSPFTSLAFQYKEAFMKANPEFRWHKMPPGTADSLTPSNAKPSTPSPSNGMVQCSVSPLITDSPTSQACAPKPFKKRYLASQQSSIEPVSPTSHTSSHSSLSSAGVSPEAARACEALMELARNESCGSRSSEGSDVRRDSPSDTPPLQTLREAVWSKVAGTLLKQEEEKLVVPQPDCPMNLTNQCTIRGQQIIEHIIENILSIPMNGPLDPASEPITFSVNNNQDARDTSHPSPARHHPSLSLPNGDVGDSIKASIYESLKNDLLKGKVTPTLPTSTPRLPAVASHSSPTVSPNAVRQRAPKKQPEPAPAPTVTPSPPSGQDVLRLLGSGQLPINVGNSAITITKTPRVSLSSPHPPTHAPSFPAQPPPPSSPVSLSLTRTGPTRTFPASFSLNGSLPVLLSPQTMVLSSPANLVLQGLPGRQGPQDCVLLAPVQGSQGQQVLLGSSAGHQQQHLLLAGTKLVLAQPPPSQASPPPSRVLTSDPVNLSIQPARSSPQPQPRPVEVTREPVKRPAPADPIGEERRSSRTGRGRRYQEFIEDISSSKKKRRSHRSGEEYSEPEVEIEALPSEPELRSPATTTEPPTSQQQQQQQHQPVQQQQQHVHWKKMRTASLSTESSPSKPPLANQETATAKLPQNFDLDAKMEKMEPLKFPDTFGRATKAASSSLPSRTASSGSGRCSTRQAHLDRSMAPSSGAVLNHSKAFEPRPNKKSSR